MRTSNASAEAAGVEASPGTDTNADTSAEAAITAEGADASIRPAALDPWRSEAAPRAKISCIRRMDIASSWGRQASVRSSYQRHQAGRRVRFGIIGAP